MKPLASFGCAVSSPRIWGGQNNNATTVVPTATTLRRCNPAEDDLAKLVEDLNMAGSRKKRSAEPATLTGRPRRRTQRAGRRKRTLALFQLLDGPGTARNTAAVGSRVPCKFNHVRGGDARHAIRVTCPTLNARSVTLDRN